MGWPGQHHVRVVSDPSADASEDPGPDWTEDGSIRPSAASG
jgi:hypothetical protein